MKVLIVGTGNVARHLAERFQEKDIAFAVKGSSDEKSKRFADEFNVPYLKSDEKPYAFELALLCVPDRLLNELLPTYAKYLPSATVSGAFSIEHLQSTFPIGVCYPLQTFSTVKPDWSKIPFFIESPDARFERKLFELGEQLGKCAEIMSSENRVHLHITAVFVNNFVNHLHVLAQEYATSKGIDFSHFAALIEETQRKITNGTFTDQQTGPARRGDISTIEQHLSLLPEPLKDLYKNLSSDILKRYHNKTL